MEGAREFLQSSTIHGLAYIGSDRSQVRLFWIFVVITGFSAAGLMIDQAFSSWADSPISTTIETRPITDLDFPNVTLCPPRNSYTSLIPDLVRARKMIFDEKKRKELSDFVPAAVFEENYNAKYQEFLEYSQSEGQYLNWYTGISNITLPYKEDTYSRKCFKIRLDTASLTGSVSTPYFSKSFDESKFELMIDWTFNLLVPSNLTEGSNLVVDFEYDLDHSVSLDGYNDRVNIWWKSQKYNNTSGNYYFSPDDHEILDKTKRSARRTFLASENSADGKKNVKSNNFLKVIFFYQDPKEIILTLVAMAGIWRILQVDQQASHRAESVLALHPSTGGSTQHQLY